MTQYLAEEEVVRNKVFHFASNIRWWLKNERKSSVWTLKKRLEWLKTLDLLIKSKRTEICSTIAATKGVSTENAMMNEYSPVRLLLRYYIDNATRILSDEKRSRPLSLSFGDKNVTLVKEPIGVVGIISPFNYPFALALGPIAAAITAGNGVILKPSPETPAVNFLIERLLRDTLRQFAAEDLFWMLPPGVEYGQALVKEKNVGKIHFTGSVAGGWSVAEANASARFIPPTLELGGSNPAIVLEDANLEEAAREIVWSRFCGLSCNSIKRVFVSASVFYKFMHIIRNMVQLLEPHEKIGFLPEREYGNYARFVNQYSARSINKALQLVLAEKREAPPIALFLSRYDPELYLLKEETFCPILPVVQCKDEMEAIALANDTEFGLGASIFTSDSGKFRKMAKLLQCGTVCHNSALSEFAQPQVPFGGRKNSGWGHAHGPEGLLDFTQLKTVVRESTDVFSRAVRVSGLRKIHLYPWTAKKLAFLRRWLDKIIEHS